MKKNYTGRDVLMRALRNIGCNTLYNMVSFIDTLKVLGYVIGLPCALGVVLSYPAMALANGIGILITGEKYPMEVHQEIVIPAVFVLLVGGSLYKWFCNELLEAEAELAAES